MEKGVFSLFHLADLSPWQRNKFSIFGNEQKKKKRTEEKIIFYLLLFFFFFFFFFFFNSHRVSFFA